MSKPTGRRPRARRPRFEQPDKDRPVLIEDVDGVTVVVRTHYPLTEADRDMLREYVTQLQLGAQGEVEVTLPDSLQGVPVTTQLDEATVWLSRDQLGEPQASPRGDAGRCTVCGRMTCTELHHA